MTNLRTLSAAVALAASAAAGNTTASLAAGRGPGPAPRPQATLWRGRPAMSGGQLMAGVGQCQRISSWYARYGAGRLRVGPAPSNPYYGRNLILRRRTRFLRAVTCARDTGPVAGQVRAAIRLAAARAAAAHARRCALTTCTVKVRVRGPTRTRV